MFTYDIQSVSYSLKVRHMLTNKSYTGRSCMFFSNYILMRKEYCFEGKTR
ncbi:hypothetical protein HanIR_Chr01g0017981 [Helianthus annuus]|nr:hypothetical protein HanIR_Chr01g0017981 [Helianthus annuus]